MDVLAFTGQGEVTTGFLSRDTWLLFGSRSIRLFAYGLLSVILALHLAAVGLSDRQIGLLLSCTLVGDAVISLFIARFADRIGRRRMLLVGAGLMVLAGIVFGLTSNPLVLSLVAFVGVLSPTGNEAGPFIAIEQAALAQITDDRQRTRVFAWYNLVGSLATAVGALAGGVVTVELQRWGYSQLHSYRLLFAVYAVLGVALGLLFLIASSRVEVVTTQVHGPGLTGLHRSRGLVRNLSGLFFVDSFAGGLVVQSLLAYWFYLRFGADVATLGQLFFWVHIVAGLSALVAARLAAQFGLINTMVFTHIPANVFLLLTPLMPTLTLAMMMCVLRYCLAQMDVPARHSYLMAVVATDERSAAAGMTTFARTAGSALAPAMTGAFFSAAFLNAPFFLAGGVKIAYDVALYFCFRDIKPPEEQAPTS
ncbi:MAG: MFS transporter [Deltaproteobacteria bacterium]|nr:MFS transporter [Deltaproteobacteria bacterium]